MLAPPIFRPETKIITGDCLALLRTMQDDCVHCVVTSPPYFGLRDYGTASWEGGYLNCDHLGEPFRTSAKINENWGEGFSDVKNKTKRQPMGAVCTKCGAKRIDSQIGLEASPAEYVAKLVTIFREVRRVLREDGTCWLNLGDSYAGSGKGGNPENSPHKKQRTNVGSLSVSGNTARGAAKTKFAGEDHNFSLKPKDLLGIPWRVALALQSDGWYLRQDIIWHKPNPMPESVRDRCTKAHEYLFLLTKSDRYYFDNEAIKEPSIYAPGKTHEVEREKGYYDGKYSKPQAGRNDISFKAIRETRNKRSVWTIPPKPFKEAHFATFPPALVEPCVLAGSPLHGIVLDPFAGAGTTGLVAKQHNCHFIGFELNETYAEMARKRIATS